MRCEHISISYPAVADEEGENGEYIFEGQTEKATCHHVIDRHELGFRFTLIRGSGRLLHIYMEKYNINTKQTRIL